MLGEFEVQSLLGVGGFGMVYRGYDHSLHRPVAIKEYMPSALVGRGASLALTARSTADDQPFHTGLQSFMDEARLLARFDHPSLVKVYRFWEANNTAYMAMPLYEGMTLKEARRRMSGPPPPRLGCTKCCGRCWRRCGCCTAIPCCTGMSRPTIFSCRT